MPLTRTTSATLALAAALLASTAAAAELQVLAEFGDVRPGNIAVTPQGRVFMTQAPFDRPPWRAVELKADGSRVPFPDQDWADGPEVGHVGIAPAIGIRSDRAGVVWILELGGNASPARLVGWDTRQNALHRVLEIAPQALRPTSFLQDFAIDEKRGKIYIADMTVETETAAVQPALVVVDMATGAARRVLEKDPHLMPVARDVVIEGRLLAGPPRDGKSQALHLGLNPISIDPDFSQVYFGTINGEDVFRIPAAALADASLAPEALAAQIQFYAKKGPSDGFIVDRQGRVISGDVEKSSVIASTPSGITTLAQDDLRLRWPDAFAWGPDGSLFIVANQLHTFPAFNAGVDGSNRRYFILKMSPGTGAGAS